VKTNSGYCARKGYELLWDDPNFELLQLMCSCKCEYSYSKISPIGANGSEENKMSESKGTTKASRAN
jgi:hypothetical protein